MTAVPALRSGMRRRGAPGFEHGLPGPLLTTRINTEDSLLPGMPYGPSFGAILLSHRLDRDYGMTSMTRNPRRNTGRGFQVFPQVVDLTLTFSNPGISMTAEKASAARGGRHSTGTDRCMSQRWQPMDASMTRVRRMSRIVGFSRAA